MKKPNTPREWPDGDEDIDRSKLDGDDAPELTPEVASTLRPIDEVPEMAEFLAFVRKGGRPALPEEDRKRRVTIMLDPDVIAHFKASGKGWQTRMNEALRRAAGL